MTNRTISVESPPRYGLPEDSDNTNPPRYGLPEDSDNRKAANLTTVIGDLYAGASRLYEIRKRLDDASNKLSGTRASEPETGVRGSKGEGSPPQSVLQQFINLDKQLCIDLTEIEKHVANIEAVL